MSEDGQRIKWNISQKNYKGKIYTICALLTKKSEKDCTVSTVDCKTSVDPSSLHILASIPERHSANLYIFTVSLVYSQTSWKQLTEGVARLIHLQTQVAVVAFHLKAWDNDRQKNMWLWRIGKRKNKKLCFCFCEQVIERVQNFWLT